MEHSISVIVAVMNRSERLLDGIANWTASPLVQEIIVVDWSSREPLNVEDMLTRTTKKLTLIRVDGESTWMITKANNLAASYATCDQIAKIDCDYRFTVDFLQPLEANTFRRSWHIAIDNIPAKNNNVVGFVHVPRQNFFGVGGYNERIGNYGWDDLDLYLRLQESGLQFSVMDHSKIEHLAHPDSWRWENLSITDIHKSCRDNKRIALSQKWGPTDNRAKFVVLDQQSHQITVRQVIA